MEIKDKLKKILPHWLDHNKKHGDEFLFWVEELEKSGEKELAEQLQEAVSGFATAQQALENVSRSVGGVDENLKHHHHH